MLWLQLLGERGFTLLSEGLEAHKNTDAMGFHSEGLGSVGNCLNVKDPSQPDTQVPSDLPLSRPLVTGQGGEYVGILTQDSPRLQRRYPIKSAGIRHLSTDGTGPWGLQNQLFKG